MEVLKKRAYENFKNYFYDLIDTLREWFPECEELQGLRENIDEKVLVFYQEWIEELNRPLTKKIKYSKAIERILSEPAILYHVCRYNDIEGFAEICKCDIFMKIAVVEKYEHENMSEEKKKIFWKFLYELNEACWKAQGKEPPYVPTRDEIQKNIKSKKHTNMNDSGPSMNTAFVSALSNFCKLTKNVDITENKSEEELTNIMSKWSSYLKIKIGDVSVSQLCDKKDIRIFDKICEFHPDFVVSTENVSEEVWQTITQMNGYSTVNENIPTNMMGRIESMANRLAEDIVHGRADLSSMNLTDIGQEVLSQCDEQDMNKFASNINNLIPALQSFQRNV
tara:strand:+ start:1305 stop:2315 length:1011 start_codon:yes stop_codon:yes gene_type:complete